jgi:hypothetical protein
MLNRRQTILCASVGTIAPTWVAQAAVANYDEAVTSIWRHSSTKLGDPASVLRELVRYATLAPSSHNTQCWKFRIQERAIAIEPDLSRRCPAVDPDDHHLFVSLGCAAENLAQAALAHGLKAEVIAGTTNPDAIVLNLEPTPPLVSSLFQAITDRQCTRGDYDGKPISPNELRLLERAGSGKRVRLLLITARPAMEKVLEYVVAGNSTQMRDPAFMKELSAWIRFSKDQAVQSGDGLFSGSSGNPNLPPWLGSHLMKLFFTENQKLKNTPAKSAVLRALRCFPRR